MNKTAILLTSKHGNAWVIPASPPVRNKPYKKVGGDWLPILSVCFDLTLCEPLIREYWRPVFTHLHFASMKIKLDVAPLTVNKAWKGRHFKTKEYLQFEKDVYFSLVACNVEQSKKEVFVHYVYHINNYGNTDTSNMEKTLTDMLVKRGYLLDDRYIRAIYQRKEKTSGQEWVDICIEEYKGQDVVLEGI